MMYEAVTIAGFIDQGKPGPQRVVTQLNPLGCVVGHRLILLVR